jgi:SOS-response transcriptional repressor LexA
MITEREQVVLNAVYEFYDKHGHAPTFAHISRKTKMHSSSTIHKHVTSLQMKGAIDYQEDRAGSIILPNRPKPIQRSLCPICFPRDGTSPTRFSKSVLINLEFECVGYRTTITVPKGLKVCDVQRRIATGSVRQLKKHVRTRANGRDLEIWIEALDIPRIKPMKPRGSYKSREKKELEILRLFEIMQKSPARRVHAITENDLNRSYQIYQRGEM